MHQHIQTLVDDDAEVAEDIRLHFVGLASWLERVTATGAAGRAFHLQADPAAEAQAFMATVHGAMLSARAYSDPKLCARIVRSALERLMAGR
jgi:TetR/AcrR family transcriptional regulator, transcriptional repressor for nem operon